MLEELRTLVAGVFVVCCVAILGLAGVTAVGATGQPVAVLVPGGNAAALTAVAAAGGKVVKVRGTGVVAISDSPDFVPRLYRAGAVLVLLAGTGGCGFRLPNWIGGSAV
jgi:hypothetical protein